jgi:hypothetical protein
MTPEEAMEFSRQVLEYRQKERRAECESADLLDRVCDLDKTACFMREKLTDLIDAVAKTEKTRTPDAEE